MPKKLDITEGKLGLFRALKIMYRKKYKPDEQKEIDDKRSIRKERRAEYKKKVNLPSSIELDNLSTTIYNHIKTQNNPNKQYGFRSDTRRNSFKKPSSDEWEFKYDQDKGDGSIKKDYPNNVPKKHGVYVTHLGKSDGLIKAGPKNLRAIIRRHNNLYGLGGWHDSDVGPRINQHLVSYNDTNSRLPTHQPKSKLRLYPEKNVYKPKVELHHKMKSLENYLNYYRKQKRKQKKDAEET